MGERHQWFWRVLVLFNAVGYGTKVEFSCIGSLYRHVIVILSKNSTRDIPIELSEAVAD